MSTRGTYQIENYCFYIHHDNYPAGAAHYLSRMIECDDAEGLAERFLRGNPKARFTNCHDGHGDTEFRYTVTRDDDRRVWVLMSHTEDMETWHDAKEELLSDFLITHQETGPESMQVRACTPHGSSFERVRSNYEKYLEQLGAHILRGYGIPTPDVALYKDISYVQMLARCNFEPRSYRLPFIPEIDLERLEVLSQVVNSDDFRQAVQTLKASK